MSDSTELFDLSAMQEMADGCGWSLAEFVNLYLTNTHKEMARLSEAVRDGNGVERKRLAHGIAGSSATAGVIGMVPILRTIEHAEEDADVPALMQAAGDRFNAVEAALISRSARDA